VILGLLAPVLLPALGWRGCLVLLAAVVVCALLVAARCAPTAWASNGPPGSQPPPADGGTTALLWLVMCFGSLPGLAAFAHAVPLAVEAGAGPFAAGAALSVLAVGNLSGRLLAGPVGARVRVRAAVGLTLALDVVAVGLVGWGSGPEVLFAGFALLGIAYGGLSALLPAVTADVCDTRSFTRTYGRVFSGWGVAGLLSPVVVARLGDAREGLRPAMQFTGVAVLLAAAAFTALLARTVRRRDLRSRALATRAAPAPRAGQR
jgi:MFS family permease